MALLKLGAFAETLRGSAGNSTFAKTKSGTVVRDRVIPADPQTEAQSQVRKHLSTATTTFRGLSALRIKSWNQYAANFHSRSKGGKLVKKSGINVFTALATKFLQVTPGGTLPLDPPLTRFTGDSITVTATNGTGKVTFTASAANAAGVKTELLLQPLASPNRKPQKGAFKSYGFVAFASGSLSSDVIVPTGHYAAAYRFVKTASGQDTELVVLPNLTVALSLEAEQEQEQEKKGKKAA
ncbi:MAG TPA: hypothetical protein VEX38_00375 [Fimbriimonadaceae bacterium]|nr:hypothetical protein [Fimbriimonadaceae bacterium]